MGLFARPYSRAKSGRINSLASGSLLAAGLMLSPLLSLTTTLQNSAEAMVGSSRSAQKSTRKRSSTKSQKAKPKYRSIPSSNRHYKYSSRSHKATAKSRSKAKTKAVAKATPPPLRPQDFIDKLNVLTLKPGLVYRYYRGPLTINVVEVDIDRNNLAVRPYLASENFDSLKTVEEHAAESNALVTVNANYFKKDGTPLGAIKMDGEWISGSLFNRVAMGITRDKQVKFAPVNLHGVLKTSNPEVRSLWVNNMNQPRIHGAKLILYTRRWGDSVTLPYDGVVAGVSAQGEVVDLHERAMRIPYGGYVLTDRKDSELAGLKKGDFVHLKWHTSPRGWNDVEHAISGGPTLVKDGRLYVGLQAEKFRLSWTSSKITHRTACGFTRDKKLMLVTVEGPHNMWDLAKFMHSLGCEDAMNLDGGGSTTMVVCGKTVTRNASSTQRKVAATLMVLEPGAADRLVRTPDRRYHPTVDITNFTPGQGLLKQAQGTSAGLDADAARAQQKELHWLTGSKVSNFENLLRNEYKSSKPTQRGEKKSTVVFDYSKGDDVIDIDDDLVEDSDQAENARLKTLARKAKKLKRKKEEKAQKEKKSQGWSKRC
ncbi:MAG: phosphodiester glycosidase family protein [Cyanobacteriota/Melainabacteria group bacterium]